MVRQSKGTKGQMMEAPQNTLLDWYQGLMRAIWLKIGINPRWVHGLDEILSLISFSAYFINALFKIMFSLSKGLGNLPESNSDVQFYNINQSSIDLLLVMPTQTFPINNESFIALNEAALSATCGGQIKANIAYGKGETVQQVLDAIQKQGISPKAIAELDPRRGGARIFGFNQSQKLFKFDLLNNIFKANNVEGNYFKYEAVSAPNSQHIPSEDVLKKQTYADLVNLINKQLQLNKKCPICTGFKIILAYAMTMVTAALVNNLCRPNRMQILRDIPKNLLARLLSSTVTYLTVFILQHVLGQTPVGTNESLQRSTGIAAGISGIIISQLFKFDTQYAIFQHVNCLIVIMWICIITGYKYTTHMMIIVLLNILGLLTVEMLTISKKIQREWVRNALFVIIALFPSISIICTTFWLNQIQTQTRYLLIQQVAIMGATLAPVLFWAGSLYHECTGKIAVGVAALSAMLFYSNIASNYPAAQRVSETLHGVKGQSSMFTGTASQMLLFCNTELTRCEALLSNNKRQFVSVEQGGKIENLDITLGPVKHGKYTCTTSTVSAQQGSCGEVQVKFTPTSWLDDVRAFVRDE